MPEIRKNSDVVTQITTVKLTPNNQPEVLKLMQERARFMATQPASCRSAFTAAKTAVIS